MFVYIGTYTKGESKGIYVYRFDPASGKLSPTGQTLMLKHPTFQALHPSGKYLYSVSEIGDFEGSWTGGVAAMAIDPASGALKLLSQEASGGAGPCHVSVDASGKWCLVANYSAGSVAMLPINRDGSVGKATDVVQHEGTGHDPKRQDKPHAHMIIPSPDNRFAYATDLGLDRVFIYRLDLEQGKLIPHDPPFGKTADGAGPRHLAFHPNGRYLYCINELDNTITVFGYDAATGELTPLQAVSTLPEGYRETSYCADLRLTADGRFAYGSNRGHNSIAAFAVDPTTGSLAALEREPTQGDHPRNFVIDPSGEYLLVANMNGDNVLTFRIDPETGALEDLGQELSIPKPFCLTFVATES
ncbi:MAG: lactonase family protein [Armatimonadetes bacterium]|nr:lactonase family protein [Armatimonadota bacterium]